MTPDGTASESLGSRIREAWELRFNQRIDESRSRLHALRNEAGLPPLLGPELPELSAEAVELALLSASLLRAEGQLERSRELVEACERQVTSRGLPMPFQLPVQKALGLTLQGDWSRALELYLAALHRASSDWERCSALLNSLLCLENLGLPWERTRAELDELARRHRDERAYHGAFSQIEVFDRRMAFRSGDVRAVFAPLGCFEAEGVATESGYYQLWVGRLPYHRFFEKTTPEAEEHFIRSSPYFLKKSYRTRTLQGILHPDDLVSVKISELADRLYLWTWRWLADPARFPLERIMALLREFEPRDVARQTTVEDFQLIRNALTWISLFDPTSDLVVQRLLQSMAPAQNREYPILGFERELLSYLRAERDHRKTEASDFLAGLRSHPFWKSPDLKLARLADGRVPDGSPLAGLSERIARLRQPTPLARNRLRVELETGRIVSARDGRSVVSQPMAAAFDLLHSLESIDCARFAQACFGLSRFDAIIHGPKIFNLLSRMRGLAPPELRFSVKSGRVWAKGPWTQVEIERGGGLSGTIQSHPEWSTLTARTVAQASSAAADAAERWARPAQALKQLRGQAELTRKELEKLTGKSRSTANRIIERWLRQGIVVRSGKARNTVYKFIGMMMLGLGLAAAAPERAQAKPFTVWSGPCADEASQLPSMGFAFHGAYQGHPGKTYVVTSHHRVFNGNEGQGVCHFVHTGMSTQRAQLVAWDWGASLALLEVEGDFAPELLGLEGSRDYDAVKISGNWDYGETIVGASDRHLMPLLPSARVLEVVRASVSPSRIGAPVYSPSFTGPEGWAGIVSHQYVRMVPGRASSVETWDYEPEHRESHLLIIRQADVVRFINRYFRDRKGKPWRPLVGATLEDQREGRARVLVGGLIFEEDCPGADAPGLKGIGVGVPQPIGGAAEPSYCRIRVRRDEFGSWEGFESDDYPARLARLLKELRANLAQGGSAEILFSFWEDAHYAIIPYGYPSLQYFFRQTSLGERREVVIYDDRAQASMTADPDVKVLGEVSRELLQSLPSAEGLPRDSQASVNLRIRLPALLTILGSSRWADLFDTYKGRFEEFGLAGLPGVNVGPGYLGRLERLREMMKLMREKARKHFDTLWAGWFATGESYGRARHGVVKVVSRLRGDPQATEGSGLAFTHRRGRFVVTSDHVVHPSNAVEGMGYQHLIWANGNSNVENCTARHVVSEPSVGLALLQLEFCNAVAGLPFPKPAALKKDMRVRTSGYAYGSRTNQGDSGNGRLTSLASDHPFRPGGYPMVELQGVNGEYGMSGGPVGDERDGLVGILSHQLVDPRIKGQRRALEWRDGQLVSNRLYAIPGWLVQEWVEQKIHELIPPSEGRR